MHRPLVSQELAAWHKYYLPVGKRPVDLGAGCGETVQFYLKHGAEKVLAIECNPECLDNLRQNFGSNSQVQIVDFTVSDLKIDIEGAEKNMRFEAHFPFRIRRLFGFNGAPTTFNILEEDWGNIITKARRKVGMWLLPEA